MARTQRARPSPGQEPLMFEHEDAPAGLDARQLRALRAALAELLVEAARTHNEEVTDE